MSIRSTRCECSRPKLREAEAYPRCMEWDARRNWQRDKSEGVRRRPEKLAGVRRQLTKYLKEKGLEK